MGASMKLSSLWWDFADRCDMKVASWVLALFLVSAPVLVPGSAYADGNNCNQCKSEDTPPLGEKTAPPVPLLTAPEPTADTCSGAGCKDDIDNHVGTDDSDGNRFRPPPGAAAGACPRWTGLRRLRLLRLSPNGA